MNNNQLLTPSATNRRRFLHQLSGAGLALGSAPWLVACGGGSDTGPEATQAQPLNESRSYFFNLSNSKPATEYFLVAGTRHMKLAKATAADLKAIQGDIPNLPANGLTHVAHQIQMSARSPQVCYIKAVHGAGPADWDMHSIFYHVPATGISPEAALQKDCKKDGDLLRQGFTLCPAGVPAGLGSLMATENFCVGPVYDKYKDYFDHAVALISNHPEIGSFDAESLNYIHQNIICSDPNTYNLAVSLFRQGAASKTENVGWATLVPFVDPNTGKVRIDSNGQEVCMVRYSATTLNLLGLAIASVMPKVKNDANLGANITGLPADQLNAALKGKMWVVRNGTPTAPGAGTASSALFTRTPVANAAATFTSRDVSTGPGFNIINVAGSGRTVTFTVENWYLRYLGLYARFLDGNGNPIKIADLPNDAKSQFSNNNLNGTYDGFISIINQELVILGIPVKQNVQNFSIKIPDNAASVTILAGGLGHGTKSYPDTINPGAVMTAVLDLALPGLFLVMAAAQGLVSLSTKLSVATKLLISTAQVFITAITDAGLVGTFGDAKTFANLIVPVASTLLKSAKELWPLVVESLAEGEAIGVAEDCVPFGIGLIIQAVCAVATAAQITETSVEVANSPWTYATQVGLTHDLTVTLNHDPADVAGFPATATSYRLLATCDGGSPSDSGVIAMPAGTRTAPLAYTFKGLPSGGNVTVSVAFSAGSTLVGTGSTGKVSNVLDTASITIKELLVPLTSSTRYTHREKTALNSAGRHVWLPTTMPPPAPALNCGNQEGNLCSLVGITLSSPFGAVGYGWQASSKSVTSSTGATGQLYQFANISFTEDPQVGYMSSGVGFPLPARLAYDRSSPNSHSFYIDTSTGKSVVRRVNMTAVTTPPTFDRPDSNKSVGQFNFASDAFLIHPTGKLISFNSSLSKMEVLTPADAPMSDASAPLAQSYAGPGTRDGLMNGPVCAAVAPDGTILVIEQRNNRIQAFDTGANPAPVFGGGTSTMALKQRSAAQYLDISVEFTGFIYVLLLDGDTGLFVLDIYTKAGAFLSSTSDMRASKLAIDLFRNAYTLNFETIGNANFIEPSVSQWIPSVS
ncbi:MAG: repeat containing protein [Polaromonas sp.]|nr:repeat containing protein [Polaromonas sp.]